MDDVTFCDFPDFKYDQLFNDPVLMTKVVIHVYGLN